MWKKFLARYELIEDVLAGIGLICGVGIMFVGVVSRYVFNHPLTFVDEVGPIFIVWSTFVGYSIALRKDEHIKMDILYLAVKGKWKRAMDLFSYICGIVFAFFMMRYGFLAMMMQRNIIRIPIGFIFTQLRNFLQKQSSLGGMRFHNFEFFGRQTAGFIQNGIGNGNFPHIMRVG